MLGGAFLALKNADDSTSLQTVSASPPVFKYTGKLPLDLQLDLEKRQVNDTVVVHDTVTINKPKLVKVLKPKLVTDTLYKPMLMPGHIGGTSVITPSSVGREEKPKVLLIGSKPSSVTLTVDGRVVYKTGNDIHSTEDRQ